MSNDKKDKKQVIPDVGRILAAMEERGMFEAIKRVAVNFRAEDSLEVVRRIGQRRTPKFRIDDNNRFAFLNFIKWLHGDPTMEAIDPDTGKPIPGDLTKGIYLAGSPGTGKTWCMDIMRDYSVTLGIKAEFPDYPTPKLHPLTWSVHHAEDICEEYLTKGHIKDLTKSRIIAIQDMGAERKETLYMGNRVDVIRNLIEKRADIPDVITLATSNMRIQGEVIKERYGDKVFSRMRQMFNYLIISGPDRRKF